MFHPKWEAWTTAPGFALRVPDRSSSPRHQPSHGRRCCGIFQRRILVWEQGTSLGSHYKTLFPESCQTKGNNAAGKQFKESSEASHWGGRKRYTLTKAASEVSNIFIVSTREFSYWSDCVCLVVSDFTAPWAIAHQAPLLMEFSRQEYWSGVPFPTPRDLASHPCQGLNPQLLSLLHWQVDFLPLVLTGKPTGQTRHMLKEFQR